MKFMQSLAHTKLVEAIYNLPFQEYKHFLKKDNSLSQAGKQAIKL